MFVDDWMVADFDGLMSTGRWPKFDPTRTLLLETEPAEAPLRPVSLNRGPAGTATIAHFENTIVDIDVTATRSGFVLLNGAWHPWWRASVDGNSVPVLKANVLFRAVQVPAGKHRIRFEFEPIAGALAEIVRPSAKFGHANRRKAPSRVVMPAGSGS